MTAAFGTDAVFTDAGGSTTIPSVLSVAGIASLATWALGTVAFRRDRNSGMKRAVESTDAKSADARRNAGAIDGTMRLR